MGLLDLAVGGLSEKDKAIYDSVTLPKTSDPVSQIAAFDPDAMQVIQAAGEKARILMQRLGQLFDDAHGEPLDDLGIRGVCIFCDGEIDPTPQHLTSCRWERAKDAYNDVVKHAGQFMGGE